MKALRIVIAALVLLPGVSLAQQRLGASPQPEKGFEEVHISKAALAGKEIRVWAAQMIDPACNATGSMDTQILQTPKHGEARVSDEPFFGAFSEGNARYHCNSQKSPGRQVLYRSAPDFHGHDKLVLQNSTSEGRIRNWVVDIDVR